MQRQAALDRNGGEKGGGGGGAGKTHDTRDRMRVRAGKWLSDDNFSPILTPTFSAPSRPSDEHKQQGATHEQALKFRCMGVRGIVVACV